MTTGMSDGSDIAVTGEGIAAGDLIWAEQVTTTATYSADDETTATFSMGGQSGMMMGGDSSGFTPPSGMGGEMPSGGMPSGN